MMASHCSSRLAASQQRACCMPHTAVLLQATTQHTRARLVEVAAAKDASSWYQQSSGSKGSSGGGSGGSSGGSSSSSSSTQRQRRGRHYYDSTPRHRSRQNNSGSNPQTSQQHSSPPSDDYDDDTPDVEAWEVPKELSAAEQLADAVAARFGGSSSNSSGGIAGMNLSKWQEEKLLLAAAGSKKKMQVQSLAADLGLDRSAVLAWVQAFRAKPKQEQAKLLAPLQDQIKQQQQQPPAAAAASMAVPAPSSGNNSVSRRAASPQLPAVLPFSAPNPDTGYVPFAARRAGAAPKGTRLSGEALRTLERVYDRSPWPSKEMVAGLYDLHKLQRDVVLDWFVARRDMDGISHNPRQAKLERAAQQVAAAAAAAAQPQHPQQQQQQQESKGAPQQQQGTGQPAAAAAGAAVSRLTAKELASLRSALPSPKKFKGQKLAETLGIKTVTTATGGAPWVEIAGVTLVARDGAAAWRGAWRRRRAAEGLPAQRLDFQKWFT